MSKVSFSANGKEVKNAYDSILSGESTFEWALFGYENGSNEIELVDSGSGLDKLCEDFDDDEYQYAFARVIDPNSKLPRFVFISWCGESVPFSKKGMYNAYTNDVLRFFTGFHIHINARSKFDVDPDEIMKKVKSCSGANYSFHQNQSAKNKIFEGQKEQGKVELKAQENKPPVNKFQSAPKANPLNSQNSTTSAPKPNPLNSSSGTTTTTTPVTTERRPSMTRRRSSVDYNPLQPSSSRKNSLVQKESVGSIRANFENIEKAAAASNTTPERPKPATSTFTETSKPINTTIPENSSEISPTRPTLSRRSSRRSSNVDYNPLQPNAASRSASRRNSTVSGDNNLESPSAAFCTGIGNKISAFQNQIQETNEINKREQAIKKELSSKNLKSWETKSKPIPENKVEPKIERAPAPTPAAAPAPTNTNNADKGVVVKALYSYDAQEEGELSFEENEILTNIVEIPGDGWWSGNNSKGQYGMFPSNYVSTDLNASAEETEEVVEEVIVQETQEDNKPAGDNNSTAIALYDYDAQDDTEISFAEGEVITGIVLQDENWGIGYNSKNQQGMFPLNYVQFN